MFSTEQSFSSLRRWVLRLQGSNRTTKQRRRKANISADALSQYPVLSASASSLCDAKDWFAIDAGELRQLTQFEETAGK